jgi:hypothetical protein
LYNTIFREQDLQYLEEAYHNLQEAFRQVARAYIYTLIAGIEPFITAGEEEQGPIQMPNYNIPMYAPVFYGSPYGNVPATPPAPAYPQNPQQEGERR